MSSFEILDALTDMDDDLLLFAETDPPKRQSMMPRFFRYAAAACLTVVLVMATLLVTDAVSLGPNLRWTVRYREDKVTFLMKVREVPEGEVPVYELGWLPEGYEKIRESWFGHRERLISCRKGQDETKYISFSYRQIDHDTRHYFTSLPSGSYEKETVDVNGMPGELYRYTDGRCGGTLVWFQEDEVIMFVLSFQNREMDDALKVAENVILIK